MEDEGTGYTCAAGAEFEGGTVEGKLKIGAHAVALFGAGLSISVGSA